VVVRSAVTDPDSSQVLGVSTPIAKYHATDKHDTPPSHFVLTICMSPDDVM